MSANVQSDMHPLVCAWKELARNICHAHEDDYAYHVALAAAAEGTLTLPEVAELVDVINYIYLKLRWTGRRDLAWNKLSIAFFTVFHTEFAQSSSASTYKLLPFGSVAVKRNRVDMMNEFPARFAKWLKFVRSDTYPKTDTGAALIEYQWGFLYYIERTSVGIYNRIIAQTVTICIVTTASGISDPFMKRLRYESLIKYRNEWLWARMSTLLIEELLADEDWWGEDWWEGTNWQDIRPEALRVLADRASCHAPTAFGRHRRGREVYEMFLALLYRPAEARGDLAELPLELLHEIAQRV
jgi:hypothetical protein